MKLYDGLHWKWRQQSPTVKRLELALNSRFGSETLCSADDATLEFMGGVELRHKVRMARGM